jgi:hypothetical protein
MSEVDLNLLRTQLERLRKELGEAQSYTPGPVDGGGGGPHSPDMEARVVRLEAGMDEVRATLGRLEPIITRLAIDTAEMKGKVATAADLTSIRADVSGLRSDLSEVRGRVSALPSFTQSIGLNVVTLVALLAGVFGLIKALHS